MRAAEYATVIVIAFRTRRSVDTMGYRADGKGYSVDVKGYMADGGGGERGVEGHGVGGARRRGAVRAAVRDRHVLSQAPSAPRRAHPPPLRPDLQDVCRRVRRCPSNTHPMTVQCRVQHSAEYSAGQSTVQRVQHSAECSAAQRTVQRRVQYSAEYSTAQSTVQKKVQYSAEYSTGQSTAQNMGQSRKDALHP
eukprot:8847234-Pyramimonas_sp.AAC.1